MESYQINILNPKATKLLKDLADLDLISITETESFHGILSRLRSKAEPDSISLDEITKEVEEVRAKRYANPKIKELPIRDRQL